MVIELTGTNTRNKGAELMLVAVVEHFADHPDVQLAVNQFFGSYRERAQYGLLQRITLSGWGRSRVAVALMPEEFRRSFGLVHENDVDVVLDASGFAFGDQHPPERTIQFAERVEEAKQSGKPVILLPQALGPFTTSSIRDAFVRIVDAADLVYVRDDVSMKHAREAVGDPSHLEQAPDFTNLVKPARTTESDAADRATIVPNQRMIEKAETEDEASAYVPFMGMCIEAVAEAGLRPVLLLHEEDDDELASEIRESVERDVPIRQKTDPVALKRFLGESHLVVGSRFHALVGALSQGVPAVGTSWSHKYEQLFREYGCADMLLPVFADEEEVRDRVAAAMGRRRDDLQGSITERGEELKQETRTMWRTVDEVIDLGPVPA
jgi:colanic acid/amylovoran biosynthesis protein